MAGVLRVAEAPPAATRSNIKATESGVEQVHSGTPQPMGDESLGLSQPCNQVRFTGPQEGDRDVKTQVRGADLIRSMGNLYITIVHSASIPDQQEGPTEEQHLEESCHNQDSQQHRQAMSVNKDT